MLGYLIVTGILFFIVGLRALLSPVSAVAEPFLLQADSPDAKNYIRSGAGGVTLASSAVILGAVFYPRLAEPAMILCIVFLGGLVAGRLFSRAVDGNPGPPAWLAMFFELIGFVSGVYWYVDGFV